MDQSTLNIVLAIGAAACLILYLARRRKRRLLK